MQIQKICIIGIYFIERQAILELLTLSQCTSGQKKVTILFIGELITSYVLCTLVIIIHTADRQYIRAYVYVMEFDLLLRSTWMEYNAAGRGMGGCYLLFSFLHQQQTVSYEILREISNRGAYKCGWASAVAESSKARLFLPVLESEKVPPLVKFQRGPDLLKS